MASATDRPERPLNVLLARPLLSLTREYERQGGSEVPPLPMLLLALRVVGDDGIELRDAMAAARASRRVMHLCLRTAGFEARGDTRFHLTDEGRATRDRGFAALEAAEAAWAGRVGKARTAKLRASLVALVDAFELELPHYWVSYAGVDPRVTGGAFRPAKPGPPRIPARGQDWVPVLRPAGSSSAKELSLVALLAQALVAFAIEYEARAGSLTDAVHALAPLDTAGTPLAELPAGARADVNGTGKARLERHGIVEVDGDGTVRLTAIGEWLRDAYGPTTAAVEAEWCATYGAPAVSRLRAALEAVDPRLEAGLADHPVLAWSLRHGIREASGPAAG